MVQRFASLPHATHLVTPGSIFGQRDWSKGMQSDLAPAEGARSSVGAELRRTRQPHRSRNSKQSDKRGREGRKEHSRVGAALLDVVLARLLFAPGDDDDALVVERRHDVVPARDDPEALEVRLLRALEHVRLDRVEECRDGRLDVRERDGRLGTVVAAGAQRLGLGEVLGADLEAEGDALRDMASWLVTA